MGPSIAGLLVMAVFFSGLMILFRATLLGEMVVSRAMTDSAQYSLRRSNTDLRITNANMVLGNECNVAVVVENRGKTSIVDFPHMDVIVQFSGGNNISQRLTYNSSGSPSSSGEWARSFPAGSNLFEPGIFNPGETMLVSGQLTLLPGVASGSYINEGVILGGGTFSSVDTFLTVTDASVFVQGQDIIIGSEKLNITSIAGQELTVTRAVPPTMAGSYSDGTSILTLDEGVVVIGSPNGVAAMAPLSDLVVPCP